MISVAIMQPTYLPWIGYFALLDRVDVFVFLDSVQFARRSWQQRNRIKTAQGQLMLTVPVLKKGRYDQKVAEARIDQSSKFAVKHIRSIEASYASAPYFDRDAPQLFAVLRRRHEYLADLNIALIDWLAQAFGITTPKQRSSALTTSGVKADLLANICEKIGASRYVSPPGSRAYLDESSAFAERGIAVDYNDYVHPTYPQLQGDFEAYLSALDLLFNMGPDGLAVIRRGCPEFAAKA